MDVLIPTYFVLVMAFILGSVIGSFLNVCIYRLPREESIVFPVSHCPKCDRAIAPYDNIPILSFLILRGKCRHCREPISWQYPLVEALNGVFYLFTFYWFGLSWLTLIYALFISAMLVVAIVDFQHKIIPDEISIGGIPVGLALAILILPLSWIDSLLGILIGGGILFAVSRIWLIVFKEEGMGDGDIKLMAMVGAFLGWKIAILIIILGSFVGSVVGIIAMRNLKAQVPFGTFLAPVAIFCIFWGQSLVNWYLHFFQY